MCHKIIANKNVNTFQDTDPPLDIVQTILWKKKNIHQYNANVNSIFHTGIKFYNCHEMKDIYKQSL
jgi:hypothetical protein